MVVASRTSQSESQKGFSECVDAIINSVGLVLCDVHRRMDFLSKKPEPCAHNRFVCASLGIDSRMLTKIPGDLLTHKLVVGYIVIEGFDDPVAVSPSVGNGVVRFVAPCFGIADDVEPVPPESLSVVW